MHLHVEEHGSGEQVAVLLHGMTGSAESWWRLVPLLVREGYRVLAVDLPGHGDSPRDPELTVDRAADAVIETVTSMSGTRPAVAIGHSFGGLVLAAAASALQPHTTVYVDAPFTSRGGWDRAETRAEYEADRRARTYEGLRATRPYYSDEDCRVEARAAERFDPDSAAALAAGVGGAWPPAPGTIVVRADPSDYVPHDVAVQLAADGVLVRSIAGAAHAVWYSHFDEFVDALPEVIPPRRPDVAPPGTSRSRTTG